MSLPAPATSRRTCLDRLTDVAGQTEIVLEGELDAATAEHGLVYPVFPGESSARTAPQASASAGGSIAQ